MKAPVSERINHMRKALFGIQQIVTHYSRRDVSKNPILMAALERFFEIASEACRHLTEDLRASEPQIPWRAIAALGNIIRHAYDGVDLERLWIVADKDVPALLDALDRLETRLENRE